MYSPSDLSLISLPCLQCYLHHTNFQKVRGLKTGEGLEGMNVTKPRPSTVVQQNWTNIGV